MEWNILLNTSALPCVFVMLVFLIQFYIMLLLLIDCYSFFFLCSFSWNRSLFPSDLFFSIRHLNIIKNFFIKKTLHMAPMYYNDTIAVNFAPRCSYTHAASPSWSYLLFYIPQPVLSIAVPPSVTAPAAMSCFHHHSTLPLPAYPWLP